MHAQWVRNKTTSEKSRTALRTVETFILVVDRFRIVLSASSPNVRFVFGYFSLIHFKGPTASDSIYAHANCASLLSEIC